MAATALIINGAIFSLMLTAASAAGSLGIQATGNGRFEISVDGTVWFHGGNVSVTIGGKLFTSAGKSHSWDRPTKLFPQPRA